jgi:hypothetical protein
MNKQIFQVGDLVTLIIPAHISDNRGRLGIITDYIPDLWDQYGVVFVDEPESGTNWYSDYNLEKV